MLLERGAPLEATNAYGGTALGQALWSAANRDHRINYVPIVEALLAAGARVDAVPYPTGNARLDEVLQRYGAKPPGTPARREAMLETPVPADALVQRALEARRQKRLPDAKRDLDDAVARLRQHGSKSELARALRELGELERHLPDSDAAIPYYG